MLYIHPCPEGGAILGVLGEGGVGGPVLGEDQVVMHVESLLGCLDEVEQFLEFIFREVFSVTDQLIGGLELVLKIFFGELNLAFSQFGLDGCCDWRLGFGCFHPGCSSRPVCN